MHSAPSRLLALVLTAVLFQLPATAAACSTCMGDVNSKSAGAMNAAIFVMLGCIGGVLGLLVVFGLTLMKRASAPLPPHSEFSTPDSGAHANS